MGHRVWLFFMAMPLHPEHPAENGYGYLYQPAEEVFGRAERRLTTQATADGARKSIKDDRYRTVGQSRRVSNGDGESVARNSSTARRAPSQCP